MSENKCPFCGEAMITTEDKIMLCENSDCATMFNEWDYPKVAAAMELAGAEVAASNAVWSVPLERLEPAVEAAEAVLFQAKMRVLEVFK